MFIVLAWLVGPTTFCPANCQSMSFQFNSPKFRSVLSLSIGASKVSHRTISSWKQPHVVLRRLRNEYMHSGDGEEQIPRLHQVGSIDTRSCVFSRSTKPVLCSLFFLGISIIVFSVQISVLSLMFPGLISTSKEPVGPRV